MVSVCSLAFSSCLSLCQRLILFSALISVYGLKLFQMVFLMCARCWVRSRHTFRLMVFKTCVSRCRHHVSTNRTRLSPISQSLSPNRRRRRRRRCRLQPPARVRRVQLRHRRQASVLASLPKDNSHRSVSFQRRRSPAALPSMYRWSDSSSRRAELVVEVGPYDAVCLTKPRCLCRPVTFTPCDALCYYCRRSCLCTSVFIHLSSHKCEIKLSVIVSIAVFCVRHQSTDPSAVEFGQKKRLSRKKQPTDRVKNWRLNSLQVNREYSDKSRA